MSFFETESENICPLITVSQEKYKVHEETIEWLCTINKPLCIISCAGKYRTGKSFLLNCLCDNENGFKVGDTVQACTKGIWVYKTPLINDDNKMVIVMDTEGIDALDADDNHDVRIFTLALLLSSSFIYNSNGPIDESALQTLSLMTKISEFVKISNDCETTIEMLSDHMPKFYWILRDFSLQIKNRAGEACSNEEYLEEALSDSGHTEERGKVRQTVRNAFTTRKLVTLPRPNGETQNLKFSLSGQKFRTNVNNFKSELLRNIEPLKANGNSISGKMFSEMCKHFVSCINEPNSVPVIKDTWTLLADVQARDLADQLLSESEKLIETTSKTYFEYDILENELSKLKSNMIEKFSKNLMDGSDTLSLKFKESIEKLINRELLLCEDRNIRKIEQEIDKITLIMQEKQNLNLELYIKLIGDMDRSIQTQHNKFQLTGYKAIVKKSHGDWIPAIHESIKCKLEEINKLKNENENLMETIESNKKQFENEIEASNRNLDNIKIELKTEAEAMVVESKLHLEHLKQENDILTQQNEEQEKKLQELIVWQTMVTSEKEQSKLDSETITDTSIESSSTYEEDDRIFIDEEESKQNVQKIQELEAQLRTTSDELKELKAIRSTLMTQNMANKEAREKLETLCSEKLIQLQQKHSQSIQKQRESYEETIQTLNKDLENYREEDKILKEEKKSLEIRITSLENSMIENKNAYERELRIQKESQLTARATCEDLQERIVKMHSDSLEDIRVRDTTNRERQSKITEELLQSQIEKGEALRQLERCNAELNSTKRKLTDKDEIDGENRRLKQKLNEYEAKIIHLKSESEFLRTKNDELIKEREEIRSNLMQSERNNALLEREVSIFKVENDLK